MADPIDAFLELTPNGSPGGKMRNTVAGETADTKKRRGGEQAAAMEITQFNFANSKALAAMKQQEDLQELMASRAESSGDDAMEYNIPSHGKSAGARTGKTEDDYRFQIRKLVDVASPLLMQAYFSNSHSGIRPEYNDFKSAKLTFRKTDSRGPKTYLTMIFGGVYVVGYTLETEGAEPPEEAVEFCFQTCEMIYLPQKATGDLGVKNIRGWDFQAQAEYSSGGGDA